ncbi:ABC transporter ATP-binding protein [Vibrio nigripulchritudo]|uniref:ABC transporter ATP-binding protein n=1 Tax=Vibrio nigripulchritudo TaxID=28173 RepID=UPI0003B1B9D7|nr:ABC transporter ATP-binding protein [Vibrio nigripulchritudo]CCN86019.1 putative ferric transporter subunit; ATP-binding component of ABC transporter; CP4-6 prophage [Vibrio nigripulchritudo BLFn1]CCN97817.1 putative ferric transporter subunit; ATP-binding component of ABC transporter; CP4-6 prophage [Vibrio nigripulchritudo ENn2]CCO56128.1 putative ferric transporter subunit; ATP-binding component of ABC transporter; CP4-6 prophage [Vibrio nigripulchritudo Wn13]
MIEFRSVSFEYPGSNSGVYDINLTVNTGELLAVLGQSGCGKTTMLKLLAGFEKQNQGNILIDGRDQANVPCAQRNLGIVFQDYALFPHYSVLQNVMYPLKIKKVRDAHQRAMRMINLVGLSGYEHAFPSQLSGGQRQRVALARALVFQPKALLLDEPLSALDASLREEMRNEIVSLQKDLNITTFLITHDQEEAMTMADQVAVMGQGRVEQCANPMTLYHRPANLHIAGFVGRANIVPGVVKSSDSIDTPFGLLQTPEHRFNVRQSVAVIIRPEQVQAVNTAEQPNAFRVDRIESRRFLGHTTEYQVSLNGHLMKFELAHLVSPFTHVLIPTPTIHVLNGALT